MLFIMLELTLLFLAKIWRISSLPRSVDWSIEGSIISTSFHWLFERFITLRTWKFTSSYFTPFLPTLSAKLFQSERNQNQSWKSFHNFFSSLTEILTLVMVSFYSTVSSQLGKKSSSSLEEKNVFEFFSISEMGKSVLIASLLSSLLLLCFHPDKRFIFPFSEIHSSLSALQFSIAFHVVSSLYTLCIGWVFLVNIERDSRKSALVKLIKRKNFHHSIHLSGEKIIFLTLRLQRAWIRR